MSSIQLIPPGLLGFLGIKNFGANPQQLGNAYAPVLQMVPWAFMAKTENLQVGFAPGTIGGNLTLATVQSGGATFTVPAAENWYVHHLSIGLIPGAAATRVSSLNLIMQLDALGVPKNLSLAHSDLVGTNDAVAVGANDFFAPSGAILGWQANVANAAATNLAGLAAMITRLPI